MSNFRYIEWLYSIFEKMEILWKILIFANIWAVWMKFQNFLTNGFLWCIGTAPGLLDIQCWHSVQNWDMRWFDPQLQVTLKEYWKMRVKCKGRVKITRIRYFCFVFLPASELGLRIMINLYYQDIAGVFTNLPRPQHLFLLK